MLILDSFLFPLMHLCILGYSYAELPRTIHRIGSQRRAADDALGDGAAAAWKPCSAFRICSFFQGCVPAPGGISEPLASIS